MITRIEPWLLFLVITAALTFFARADLDAEKAAKFDWFGALGFTGVKEHEFVRFMYGEALYLGGRREEMWEYGFLLESGMHFFTNASRRPFRAEEYLLKPRALPWAALFCTFGAAEQTGESA